MTEEQFFTRIGKVDHQLYEKYKMESHNYWDDIDYSEEGLEQEYSLGFNDGIEFADQNPKSPWINVKDRLPNYEDRVLVENISNLGNKIALVTKRVEKENQSWAYTRYDKNGFEGVYEDVEYWMPIPELPKKGG